MSGSEKLSSLVSEFRRVCERRKLEVDEGKSKVWKFSVSGEDEPLRMRVGM